jgi:hypothetical protein
VTPETARAGCTPMGGTPATYFCTGINPFISLINLPSDSNVIFSNQAVTASGAQITSFNGSNLSFTQTTTLGIPPVAVPDIVNSQPGSGSAAAALYIHTDTGNITVVTSAANPTLGPAGNTATIRSTNDDGIDLEIQNGSGAQSLRP